MSQSPLEGTETSTVDSFSNDSPSPSRFPQTIVAVSRKEFIEPAKLTVRNSEGKEVSLPPDLSGHLFIISPVGSPDSAVVEAENQVVWVTKDGWTPIYNGDGMVYRLSFNQGEAKLQSSLVKPPCFYADLATANNSDYQDLAFQNLGISRVSLNRLGIRNQLNTAFLPFKLPDEETERLLVTWDTGRPYEIDPETLETLTPVGTNQDWQDFLPGQAPQPFKQVMSTAHPVFDPHTGELFLLNAGKSLWTMLALSRSLKQRLLDHAETIEANKSNPSAAQGIGSLLLNLYSFLLNILKGLVSLLQVGEKIYRLVTGGHDFVHLLLWDGKNVDVKQKWNIVLANGKSIKLDQTVHQMGLTRDYIVFAETSFKFSLENIFPFRKNNLGAAFKVLLADFFDYPQYPNTKLYIIKRADLNLNQNRPNWFKSLFIPKHSKGLPSVIAQEVTLEPEFSHYLVDYENPHHQIVLHISHLAATDVAEYIRIFDRSAFDDRDRDDKQEKYYDDPDLTARTQKLAGNVVSPMDISRLGRWVIDGETGMVIKGEVFPAQQDADIINQQIRAQLENPTSQAIEPKYLLPWSSAFYIYHDQRPTSQFTDVFWNSWGCWSDTLTSRSIEAYRKYPQRLVNLDNVIGLTYQGVPSNLCHMRVQINSANETELSINPENYYQFDNHYLGTSAQYIPRPNPQNQTDGYIACIVLTSDQFLAQKDPANPDLAWSQNSEIWIFDAAKLNEGPLCKLSHPQLNIGSTFHTTWMPEAKSPSNRLDYDVREDYDYLVNQLIANQPELETKIRQLFEAKIYPNFE